jgi:isochorismate synthase EntC
MNEKQSVSALLLRNAAKFAVATARQLRRLRPIWHYIRNIHGTHNARYY